MGENVDIAGLDEAEVTLIDRFIHTFNLSGLGNAEMISPADVVGALENFKRYER